MPLVDWRRAFDCILRSTALGSFLAARCQPQKPLVDLRGG
jgi:hypothetical protein